MRGNRYRDAGVDIEAGNELVRQIKADVKSTQRKGSDGQIGDFGGMFDLGALKRYQDPILVSGTDGVGTKLMIAQMMNRHDTIGIDCVAMCANDILAQGAEPLFFLDYLATGKNEPTKLSQVVSGIAAGCREAGMAIIGGETAEMPGMYPQDEYDIAGFGTGIVERDDILTSQLPQEGDCLIGITSSGIHSNGFSLVRQILFNEAHLKVTDQLDSFGGRMLGDELLTPTKIYVKSVLPLVQEHLVHGIAHITGGGLIENVPRMFSSNLTADISVVWAIPPIFSELKSRGKLTWNDCFVTFNMGIGLVLAVDPRDVDQVLSRLKDYGEQAFKIGRLNKRDSDGSSIKINVNGDEVK